jgi:hypothetical protein
MQSRMGVFLALISVEPRDPAKLRVPDDHDVGARGTSGPALPLVSVS